MSSITISSNITQLPKNCYKLSIQTTGNDMSPYVFAIEVLPTSRDPLAVPYRFSHVCKLSDYTELPIEQDPNQSYFRTNDIEMIFDTEELAKETYRIITKDITSLVEDYNESLLPEVAGSTITIGD